MDCKKITSQLLDHFYKELPTEASALVQSHLDHCDNCRLSYNKISGVLSSTSLHSDTTPNDYIDTRILAKLDNQKPSAVGVRLVWNILRPALVVSLVVLGIFTGIKISDTYTDNFTNTYIASDTKNELATQFASENYLSSANDEVIEKYLNETK
jgi:predicted anti-sigma-YlaC factor YlaD